MTRQHIVVMGVSGSGKSTVARLLSQSLGWSFAEGDDFHPGQNVRKMASGHPLTDEDRWPWLRAIRRWMDDEDRDDRDSVVSCSALKRSYRDVLRVGPGRVRFVLLDVSTEVLEKRLAGRSEHFMPATLLESQLGTLEALGEDEDGFVVTASQEQPGEVVADILRVMCPPES